MDMLTFENDEPDDTNNNDAYEWILSMLLFSACFFFVFLGCSIFITHFVLWLIVLSLRLLMILIFL
jgi:hypothetical protein